MKPQTYNSFLWNSVSDHGLHSPFVYSFVSSTFYEGRKPKNVKAAAGLDRHALETLYKVITNRKAFKLLVLGNEAPAVTEAIREVAGQENGQVWFFSELASVPGGLDMAILTGKGAESLLEQLQRAHQDSNNNTIVAVPNIHTTPFMEAAWAQIKNAPNVTVTIDTYHVGLVFFRKGQANQHFAVRPDKRVLRDALLGAKNLWGLF
ncbi:hypothetical protein AM493_00175 [Flavobacterium akiainvivens]|uniref:Uncharacterized protein n=1 Tax=Flavobacterium akiainvivens TaxID=1202724 RepID=A0A0M8MEK2_9FLAO|nr:hypothetical protein [Flavobacterium akiainvivens]KOS04631.1 hypothetical protein AM493_00175 [Flavobacterium akiainvivens]SFQ65675.1 hypothetical protein SAMN05444144_11289 [Flavobacterium akiainvivens]